MSEVANTASGIGGFLQKLYKPIILWGQSVFATKADAVTNIAYDSQNKKITKTINGTTSDVVNTSDIVSSTNVKSALGTSSGTAKFLREDGTWQTPPDTRGIFVNDTLVL